MRLTPIDLFARNAGLGELTAIVSRRVDCAPETYAAAAREIERRRSELSDRGKTLS